MRCSFAAVCAVLLGFGSFAELSLSSDATKLAAEILSATGTQGGFVVHLGTTNAELTASLRQNDGTQVHGLNRDSSVVAGLRKVIPSERYGDVAFDRLDGDQLPYIDNLVNLLVVENPSNISTEEMMRVLVPNGVVYQKKSDGTWTKSVKPRPSTIDEWSHYLHDPTGNAVAHDQEVAPPRHLEPIEVFGFFRMAHRLSGP
jgi:hypothetical protein